MPATACLAPNNRLLNKYMLMLNLVRHSAFTLVLGLTSLISLTAQAAPYTPATEAEVVERLPGRASDPALRRVDSLRKQLAARPNDPTLRLEIARRYFDMATAQGDPRYMGYASAAIAPLEKSAPDNADYWMVLGLIQQFSHDFEPALASLSKASELNRSSPEPLLWRAAIFMVEARYAEAQIECQRLAPLSEPLLGTGCSAYVQAMTGQLEPAFKKLQAAVENTKNAGPELLLWQYTRLAEMALRLQRNEVAEGYFKSAFKLGITDQFLLGAYADFLLARQRPVEVLKLLLDWERSDILLLRLALAGSITKDSRADNWAAQLRDRFQAAALRGDRLHEQESARFQLDIERNVVKALELAGSNYQIQKEPRDAEILLRAALAARQPKAAQPALEWLRTSRYQDPAIEQLANQLTTQGVTR